MRKFTVSVVLSFPEQLLPEIPGLEIQGANLMIARWLHLVLSDERTASLEVFLPPSEYQRHTVLAEVAGHVLPEHRKGQGFLRFYPLTALPEVWADGDPRIMLCTDIELYPRDRYLRDRFATGPTAIYAQVHGLGHTRTYDSLRAMAASAPVPFDMIGSLSRSCDGHMRRYFEMHQPTPPYDQTYSYEVIPNPVDSDRFCPPTPKTKASLRDEYELPADATIALYFGRLTPHSKADLLPLVRQFSLVSGPKDLLLFAGIENTPGYAQRILDFSQELGIRDRVVYREGKDPSKRHHYFSMSDLFVFPCDNVQECMGNTVLEAMAAGLPVIATDWDGMRDMVVDGETGTLIPTLWMPGLERIESLSPALPFMNFMLYVSQNCIVDAPKLGSALRNLLRDPATRASQGKMGRKRIMEVFRWEAVGDRLFAAWGRALDRAASETPQQRSDRRKQAEESGLAIPSSRLFGHYATHQPTSEQVVVKLSDIGARYVDRVEPLFFYDETLPLLRPEVIAAIFHQVTSSGLVGMKLSRLTEVVGVELGVPIDDVAYAVTLLAKRDSFTLEVNTSE